MLKQFVWKRRKIARGWYRTHVKRSDSTYRSAWWDDSFFAGGVSDRLTIDASASDLASAYHYTSVETLILRGLMEHGITPRNVCDIGSGAGHWLGFYSGLGAAVTGMDISRKCADFLRSRYPAVHHGPADAVLAGMPATFDLVNAIGVMFHMVDDVQWHATIREVGRVLKPGGIFIVGGHFGWLDGLNVQFDADTVNKRLRSARHWKNTLRAAGMDTVRIYRNRAYLHATQPIPENNILIARKRE